jgi:hypothetical protein
VNGNLVSENAGSSVAMQAGSKWFSGQNTTNSDNNNFYASDLVGYRRVLSGSEVKQLARLGEEIKATEKFYLSRDSHATQLHGVQCLPWEQGFRSIFEE